MSHCWEKKKGRKQIKSSNSNKSINYMQMLYWICSSTALMYAAKTTQQKYFPHLSQIQMHWVSILDAEHDFSVVYTIINIAFHTNARAVLLFKSSSSDQSEGWKSDFFNLVTITHFLQLVLREILDVLPTKRFSFVNISGTSWLNSPLQVTSEHLIWVKVNIFIWPFDKNEFSYFVVELFKCALPSPNLYSRFMSCCPDIRL